MNFSNNNRNCIIFDKFPMKTYSFLPFFVVIDLLGFSETEKKDIINTYYKFPAYELTSMETDIFRLILYMQKTEPIISYTIEQLYLILLYQAKELIETHTNLIKEPLNVSIAIPSYYSKLQQRIITQLIHSLSIYLLFI